MDRDSFRLRIKQISRGRFHWLPRRVLIRIVRSFCNKPAGIEVIEQDWDTLIVLDACRYDAFAEIEPYLPLDGHLEKAVSKGTNTRQWLEENFGKKRFDAVYVSANPWIGEGSLINQDHFTYIEEVWKNKWCERYETVLAEDVTVSALEVREKFPMKRMIVHYLQPHNPFIGKTKLYGHSRYRNIWNEENVKEAWKDNLVYVIKKAISLVRSLEDEKIVITSDHGDSFRLIGRGHNYRLNLPELYEIPWYVIDKRTKKKEIERRIRGIRKKI